MKFILLLLLVLNTCLVSAQPYKTIKVYKPYHWMIGVHWSAIDDDGKKFEGMFDLGPSWNFAPYPTRITVDRYFIYGWSMEVAATYNEYLPAKRVNDTTHLSSTFICFDVNGKYSFYNQYAPRARWIEPYFTFGLGYTYRNNAAASMHTPTVNLGFGLNIWILKNIGFQFHSNGKLAVYPTFWDTHDNYLQHNAGIVYRFKTGKQSNKEFHKRKHKWAHGNKRYKQKNGQ